jgi:hypothetical protein
MCNVMDFCTLFPGEVKATAVPGPWPGRFAAVSDALSNALRRNRDGAHIAHGWDEELHQMVVSLNLCHSWSGPSRPYPCHLTSFPFPFPSPSPSPFSSLPSPFATPPIPLSPFVSAQRSILTFSMSPELHQRYPFPQAKWQNRDPLDGLSKCRESRPC